MMATRAALYARYSSTRQSDQSIEDQVELCRRYAAGRQFTIVQIYEDRARSGATVAGRDGLEAMLAGARGGQFDCLVIESLDRISRDSGDMADVFKSLRRLGVAIEEVHGGPVGVLQVGVRGLVGSLYLEDLANKTRRGQAGVLRDGRIPGGRAYGYRPVPGKPGEVSIDADQANVVRRIFSEFVAGATPQEIGRRLTADGIPPPRGNYWLASTIRGDAKRANGMLRCRLYIGEIVWNRQRFMKDPATGTRVSRANPADQVQTKAVPALAIVDRALFDAAQQLLRARATPRPYTMRRAKHLLTGLLRCGVCGAGIGSLGKRGEDQRLCCSRRREMRDCRHSGIYYRSQIEGRVLGGLAEHLRDPRLIAEYVAAYREERRRLASTMRSEHQGHERRLAQLESELERTVTLLIKGVLSEEIGGPRVKAMQAEQKILQTTLAALPGDDVVELHPAAVARYLGQIEQLGQQLQGDDRNTTVARESLRELIDAVTIFPGKLGGFDLEIKGRLSGLLGPGTLPHGRLSGMVGKGGCGGRI